MIKRIISLVMVLCIVFPLGIAFSEETQPKWEDREIKYDVEWPWKPPADYISEQNAPDFTWPKVGHAISYDLIICSDNRLENIKYEKRDLKNNYYNFPYTFEPGTYWWSVRYRCKDGYSEWSPALRFLLRPDAYRFVLPDISEALKLIPEGHPRLVTTGEELEEFRKLKDSTGYSYYENLKNTVAGYMAEPMMTEPEVGGDRNHSLAVLNRLNNSGILYMLDGDPTVGQWCAKLLMEVVSWDINGTTRYELNDQCHYEYMQGMGYAYDYVYDLLTPAQRKQFCEVFEKRLIIHEHPTSGLVGDSIYRVPENPFQSHGLTAIGTLLPAVIATYGDVPFSKTFLERYLALWSIADPIWGWEDGGWANGTGYGRYGVIRSDLLLYSFKKLGIIDLSNKAYFNNLYKYMLYFLGINSGANFGDEASGILENNFATHNYVLNKFVGNLYSLWMNERYGKKPNPSFSLYFLSENEGAKAKAPVDLPRSAVLKDIGWAALHSELTDMSNRVSLYFKASRYGSYNHSHGDNNGFIITAFDETLAADTGYYDAYGSNHHTNYTETSHAHNTITFDGGKGTQESHRMDENAGIANFITHPDFDLVGGTTGDIYNYVDGKLQKPGSLKSFERNIIYVRPDMYLVLDDLKKADGKASTFEFWLNSDKKLEMYKSKNGARITGEKAALDVQVKYPEVTGSYSDIFSGADLVEYTPGGSYAGQKVTERAWFSTKDAYEEIRLMTVMSVSQKDDEPRYTDATDRGDYVEFAFEDGTVIYANKTHGEMKCREFVTDAAAIAVKKKTLMVVDATYVRRNGETLLESDKDISFVYGKGELSFSADNDASFKIKTDEIKSVLNEKGTVITPGKMEYGYNWCYKDGYFTAEMYKGFFTLYLNGKKLPGVPVSSRKIAYEVDSQKYEADANTYYNHDGELVSNAEVTASPNYYFIEEMNGISLEKNVIAGKPISVNGIISASVTGEKPVLKMRSMSGGKKLNGLKNNNTDEVRAKLDIFREAELFDAEYGSAAYRAVAFLSGGAALSNHDTMDDSVLWKIDAPEDGEYYLAVKYASWSSENGKVRRLISVNDVAYDLILPSTETYAQAEADFTAAVTNETVSLKKGENTIILMPEVGMMRTDWLGFIKK